MQRVTGALKRMLHQHEPFPAMVMDRYWNVLMTNQAAPRFFGSFIDLATHPTPRNLLHMMFDPAAMRPFIANWDDAAKSLLARVYRESVGRVVDEKTRHLLTELLAYPDVKPEWQAPDHPGAMPVIPLGFIKDGAVLNYFSLITTVGTPQTTAAQELRVECMFPADDATERHHLELMADDAGTRH
jgi:hypothetical protein